MANDSSILNDEYLTRTRELLHYMEEGNEEGAARVLDELTRLREDSLFRELGKLTREFHEALNNFRLDSRVTELAEHEIPDARDRLSYVITMTEQAANSTLTAVETTLPLCETLEQRVTALKGQWDRFKRREMDAQAFRALSHDLESFLQNAGGDLPKVRQNLQDVLMAQGFQDLTGQIIRRVITLVEELERNLVELVRISGQKMLPPQVPEQKTASGSHAFGPAVPGLDSGTVSGQDEVDDLLSSLGF